jgi:hypothetical protein
MKSDRWGSQRVHKQGDADEFYRENGGSSWLNVISLAQ